MYANNPGRDPPEAILTSTTMALEEFRTWLEDFGPSNFNEATNWRTDDDKPGEIWSGKFNSGAFRVDWERTKKILENEFAGFERPWTVVDKIAKKNYEHRGDLHFEPSHSGDDRGNK